MTGILFLGFVATMTALVVATIARYFSASAAWWTLAGLVVWLNLAGVLGYTGILRNTTTHPPGAVFLVLPVLLFLFAFGAFVVFSPAGVRMALAVPPPILFGGQSFRIVVELFLHRLWIAGLVPKMLTFEGENVDIYVAVSAAFIAWLATRGRYGLRFAFAWNVLGLLALINVVVRAVLTAPGPLNRIHTEVPNLLLGTFPYLFIPGFFVPLAVVLHLLSLRAINSRLRLLSTAS